MSSLYSTYVLNSLTFLAYFQFLKSAIVLTHYSGVICDAITASGVGRSCSFMAQSIAYDPRTSTKKGFFSRPVLAPRGGPEAQFPLYFPYKVNFYNYREAWCWTGRGGGVIAKSLLKTRQNFAIILRNLGENLRFSSDIFYGWTVARWKKALFLLKTLELLNRSSDVGELFWWNVGC